MRAAPSDSHALVAFGRFLAEWASLTADPDVATGLWEQADTHFASAHRLAPSDSYPLVNWANGVFGNIHDFISATALRKLSQNRELVTGLPGKFIFSYSFLK